MARRLVLATIVVSMLAPVRAEAFISPAIGTRGMCPADMVPVPPGSYTPGKKDSEVVLLGFCMDKTEVVVADYKSCVLSGGCTADGLGCAFGNYERTGADDHPINCTSRDQAKAYCAFRGKRLPTEDEWEWAARGGPRAYKLSWSDVGSPNASGMLCASVGIASRNGTCAVRSFPPTELGLYDIVGNVWEWTLSEAGSFSPSSPKNPMWRGGAGWATTTPPDVTLRYDATVDFRHGGVGFRCVK